MISGNKTQRKLREVLALLGTQNSWMQYELKSHIGIAWTNNLCPTQTLQKKECIIMSFKKNVFSSNGRRETKKAPRLSKNTICYKGIFDFKFCSL